MGGSSQTDIPSPTGIFRVVWLCTVLFGASLPIGSVFSQDRPALRLDPERPVNHFARQAWTTSDGLPANEVREVYQDEQGYIWLATPQGLVQFNGYSFETYREANTEGMQSNEIFTIDEDPGEGFWIGTQGGGISHYKSGTFTSYTEEDGLSDNTVNDLYIDNTGVAWISTDQGVSRLEDGTFENYTLEDGLPGYASLTIEGNGTDRVWIGTEQGLWTIHDGELGPVEGFTGSLPDERITALEYTAEGALWVGSYHGACRLHQGRSMCYTTEDGLTSNEVWRLYEDVAGAIWIGTNDEGINRIYEGEISTLTTEQGLLSNDITSIYQDKEHNLWIGVVGGLVQLHHSKFISYTRAEGLIGDNILSVMEDSRGTLWIGSDGNGLTEMQADGSIHHHDASTGLPGNSVYVLHEDAQGNLWVGFRYAGICRKEAQDYACITTDDGLPSNTVFSVHESSDGTMWIATNNGFARLRNGSLTSYTRDNGFNAQFAVSITEGPEGLRWIATLGNGLFRMNGDGSFTQFANADGLTNERLVTMFRDDEVALWVGTAAGGICRYREGEISCITVDHGLPTNAVLQLVEDDLGNLWAGTYNGIFRVDKDRLNAVADGRRDTLQAEVFDIYDGLPNNEVNGGTHPTTWKSRDGRLFFSTLSGVAIVDPNVLPRNTRPPPVHIERTLVEDEEVTLPDSTRLRPEARKLEFHYAALSYIYPSQITYQYKLQGYDSDWITATDRRVAYYTNLAPGTYTFRVRATNKDGVWSRRDATLTLTIQPFFYETIWFYILCGIGVILLGLGGYHLRVRHLRAREEELSHLVEERTGELRKREEELEELNEDLEEEVERQLEIILAEREKVERKRIQLEERKRYEEKLIEAKEEAEESARLKSTILMNMSHEIRTPLTSILGFAEVLEEEIDGDLLQFAQLIHKSGKRLLDTLNSVLDMSQLEANSMTVEASEVNILEEIEDSIDMMQNQASEKDLYLKLEANGVERPLSAHIDQSFLNRIVNNLIGNALKFTEEGGITVRVHTEDNDVIIEVEDTGIGIDEEFLPQLFDAFKQESTGLRRSHEGTGLGLAITKRLVELMDGSIDVETERGTGTTFVIQFPRKVHELQSEPALEGP